jgi:hypothetical protein
MLLRFLENMPVLTISNFFSLLSFAELTSSSVWTSHTKQISLCLTMLSLVFFALDATPVARFRLVVTIWPLCRNKLGRKTWKKLERAEIRHNFASEIRNETVL